MKRRENKRIERREENGKEERPKQDQRKQKIQKEREGPKERGEEKKTRNKKDERKRKEGKKMKSVDERKDKTTHPSLKMSYSPYPNWEKRKLLTFKHLIQNAHCFFSDHKLYILQGIYTSCGKQRTST